jgi:DMSO reductase family type II enzyme heme b subunit
MRSGWSVTRFASRVVPGRDAFAAGCRRAGVAVLGSVLMATASSVAAGSVAAQPAEHPGKAPYDKWCAGCHGVGGDGRGPAADWMLPRPRDFTRAQYQIKSTHPDALASDADILRIIDEGMPGTAMPGWRNRLSRSEREALVGYLKSFSPFYEGESPPEPLRVGRAPRASAEALAEGRRVYDQIECWQCHGQAGRADGTSAPELEDDNGHPIRPADLTQNWRFSGGGTTEQIFARLMTGLDGTPMPSQADLIDGGVITEDQLWQVALYVRSLAPDRPPRVPDVIRAALVEGPLPSSVDDPAWDGGARNYIPLVGQIIVAPRTFSPTVTAVWVQALHDGQELALRLTWHDPSRSPDPAWEEWRTRIVAAMEPREDPEPEPDAPDRFTVQFPAVMPDGRDLPFFLGGDSRRPVYLWRWRSDRPGIEEAAGRGLDEVRPLPEGDSSPAAEASFEDGAWRLFIRRPLDTSDPEQRLNLPEGEPIPIAFFAQDGSSGETHHRGSISSWYFLHLDMPVAATIYTVPVTVTLLTALLGVAIVARAQRTHRAAQPRSEPETHPEGA